MSTHDYTFAGTLAISQRAAWRIEDLIGGDKRLDFAQPFMPESLAGTAALGFMTPQERLTLSQIRGNAYLCTFGIVEEFILPFLLDHVRPRLREDVVEVAALLDAAICQQVEFDLDALERASRSWQGSERERAVAAQRKANRYTYLGSGMTHPEFRAQLAALGPGLAERVTGAAPAFR